MPDISVYDKLQQDMPSQNERASERILMEFGDVTLREKEADSIFNNLEFISTILETVYQSPGVKRAYMMTRSMIALMDKAISESNQTEKR